MKKLIKNLSLGLLAIIVLTSCGGDKKTEESKEQIVEIDPMKDRGIGPITHVDINNEIDNNMAERGQELFKSMCSACHKIDQRVIGPALAGVTKKRTPEWIMNMIMNPNQMVKENAQARKLLAEYISPMANQNLTEEETRSVLEYFRRNDN
jgi:cytochrome c